ncbi:hypothetical protein [Arenimonas alkanexedens]
MLTITAHSMRWIQGEADNPADQCAHGEVAMAAHGVNFVGAEDGEITLSGAAFYLLRTLDSSHTPDASVAPENVLLPCCAFSAWPVGENDSLLIMGCGGGVDLSIEHLPENLVRVVRGERSAVVSLQAWRTAVIAFARQVEEFYAASTPKAELDDDLDRCGWAMFWAEWRERVDRHASSV